MTQPSSPGIGFAFAVQSAKGSYPSAGSDWKKVRAVNANIGQRQGFGAFGLEVGGTYHPSGQYKMYNVGAGTARMYTRLEGDMGYLIYLLLGGVSSSGTSDSGAYETAFNPVSSVYNHPWGSFRRLIPNSDSGKVEGEELNDGKIASLTITAGAGQPAIADLSVLALNSASASDASDWSSDMTDTFEDDTSIAIMPVSVRPIIKAVTGIDLGGGVSSDFSVPTVQFTLQIANNFSGSNITDELVVGSHSLDDLVLLSQSAQFEMIYKWKDPYLYRAILNHGHNAYSWSPTVLESEVDFELRSPSLISGTSLYQAAKFKLTSVTLNCQDGITLVGGGFLATRITGLAKTQTSPEDYMTVTFINGTDYSDLGVAYSSGTITQ